MIAAIAPVTFRLLRLLRLRLRLDVIARSRRVSGMFPRIVSTKYRRRVIEPLLLQCQHRTGASMLGGSSAVGDYGLTFAEFAEMLFGFVQRNADGTGNLLVG